PDVTSSGAAMTLSINGLTATSVKLADGTSNPTAQHVVAGRLVTLWHDGSLFRVQQTGGGTYCESSSASGSAYTCAPSPAVSSLQKGMVLNWLPDVVTSGGAITLAVNGLTATSVKLSDGVTDPSVADVAAAKFISIWYDGSVFRLMTQD